MEFKQFRYSEIAKSRRLNGVFRPLQPNSRQESFGSKVSSKLDQERLRFVDGSKLNFESGSSGFKVIPTKELCRVYLKKSDLLASKGVIDAQARPPHIQRKSLGLKVYGEVEKNRRFGRRCEEQNSKSKMRYRSNVDPSKPKIGKKESSVRSFSPLGFGSDSHLRDRKKGVYMSLEKKSKKVCSDGTMFSNKKDTVVRNGGSKLMVSTSRDRAPADVKWGQISSVGFISKDDNENSLDCSTPSHECQANSEEGHQPSPVSVLEPMFCEDMLEDDEESPHLDFYGLEKQLDILKSEFDSYSDGSGMEVSSDEESVYDPKTKERVDNEQIGFLDTEESRDSSYIDDILAEVLAGKNSVPEKWDSLDLVITSKIFEKLEKKYYTVTSWKRSERRILFDRVSSGLAEILESLTATPTWKKPVSRRLGTVLSTCGLKQELCKVLDRQEKRAKKESLAKVTVVDIIDGWLELEADDESVVCELESMLVDELLAEVVSFM